MEYAELTDWLVRRARMVRRAKNAAMRAGTELDLSPEVVEFRRGGERRNKWSNASGCDLVKFFCIYAPLKSEYLCFFLGKNYLYKPYVMIFWLLNQGRCCLSTLRELGSECHETVRSIPGVGVRALRELFPNLRGLGKTQFWCTNGCVITDKTFHIQCWRLRV